jgi:flagellar protein FlgJ
VKPLAEAEYDLYGTPISVAIAQSAYESGWGGSCPATNFNNLFGIECPKGTSPYAADCRLAPCSDTHNRRVYGSWGDSFKDHGYLLRNSGYYDGAWQYACEPDRFIESIAATYSGGDGTYYSDQVKIIMRAHHSCPR